MREGACWSQIKDGVCEQELSMKVTRSQCCGSIGRAWGTPCEPCERDDSCPVGYYMGRGLTCLDIDECARFSGLCSDGTCINTPGSFTCQCHGGLTLDASGQRCIGAEFVKPCDCNET